ncbi:LytTR family transcriptional regulator [[Clostridium] innocuum]|nr:LytTR family transcriptional regulator [[Clostridium] innocuum]
MKLKLLCRKEMRNQLLEDLQNGQVTICEDADFVLYEANHDSRYLLVKDQEEYMRLAVEDIIYIESISQEIWIHTGEGRYRARETMYQLEANLYEKGFLRVHKSFIVNKKDILRIRSSLNSKFTLLLTNGDQIEVSRSYYYRFKEEMGF